MKLYTKTGDTGKTSIIGGRVDKDHARVEAYGTIDELNSFIGKAVTELDKGIFADILADLEAIQHELFDGGGDLANVMKNRVYKLTEAPIEVLEQRIDKLAEEAPALNEIYFTRRFTGSSNASYCTYNCASCRTSNGYINARSGRCFTCCAKIFKSFIRLFICSSTCCELPFKYFRC